MSQRPPSTPVASAKSTFEPTTPVDLIERALIVGFSEDLHSALLDHAPDSLVVEPIDAAQLDASRLVATIVASDPVAVCFGRQATATQVRETFDALATRGVLPPPIVLGGVAMDTGSDLDDLAPVFYRSPGGLGGADLAAIIASARRAQAHRDTPSDHARVDTDQADALDADLATCRDADAGADRLSHALREALGAAHVDLWIEAPGGGRLRRPRASGKDRIASLNAGIVGFVARTGDSVLRDDLREDPRYEPAIDQPPKIEAGPAIVIGLIEAADGRAAVVGTYRRVGEDPFSAEDRARLDQLLARAKPHLRRWTAAEVTQNAMVAGTRGLYRSEALAAYLDGDRAAGDLLRTDPGWTRNTYRLLLGALLIGVLFTIVAPISDYASGPAVIRFGDRVEITVFDAGTVGEVLVKPRQAVTAGELLVRFHSPQEQAEWMRLEQEFALRLRQRLRDPGDRGTEQDLIATRTHMELARAKLDDRQIRAPESGIVSDIRIRPGLHLLAGDVLLTLVTDTEVASLLALLPGKDRPTLAPGQRLRLELNGYPGAHQDLLITAVGQDVVGPAEALRALGGTVADTVPVEGPVVLVETTLESTTFESDGQQLTLHDGMQGSVEIKTRTRPLLLHLIPGLESLLHGHSHG